MADQIEGLEPETHRHIGRSGEFTGPVYPCGCEYRQVGTKPDKHRWFLCGYHSGMEDGIMMGAARG